MIEVLLPDLTSAPPSEGDWRERSACRLTSVSPDTWFPISNDDADATLAKAICHACSVRQICLDDSLTSPGISGIWGGLDDQERARMRRRIREAKS